MKKHIFAGIAIACLCATASAQIYGVVSVGQSRLGLDCTGASTCDKTDTAFKLLGGYKFNPNLAAELGHFDFGRATASGGGVTGEIANRAFGGGMAYHADLASNWNFVARLGLAQVRTKVTGTIAGLGSASDSDSNVAAYAGLGVGYKLSKSMSLDFAWDASRSKYDKYGASESGSISVLSVGLTFGF